MSFGSVQHYPVRVNLINEKQIDAYVALAEYRKYKRRGSLAQRTSGHLH